ncbi:hypothetical protein [Pseudonocardia sp. T1-2H]|uniref:hypothetical protein n=1 Tax=Pseudonocardia sp. T1-2H TaxID=3128899 RepID=UPI003100E0AF
MVHPRRHPPPGPGGLGIIAVAAVVAGVFFGRAMSLVLGGMQLRGERRTLGTETTGRAGVARATIPVGVPAAEVLRRGAGAAAALPRAEVTSIDPEAGTLALRVGMSWRSWGERIEITAAQRFGFATDVTITSRSAMPWTLVDHGVNARNVERLAGWARGL